MSLLDWFRKRKQKNEMPPSCPSGLQYQGIDIEITFHREESLQHIAQDFEALQNEGIETVIREQFIPWFKGEEFQDREDEKIFHGLRIYAIDYSYGQIAASYSPTGEDAFFGQFEFDFESSDAYTADMLEGTAMQVYVYEGKVVKVSGYEI